MCGWDKYDDPRTPSPLPPPLPPLQPHFTIDQRLRFVEQIQATTLNRLQNIETLLQQPGARIQQPRHVHQSPAVSSESYPSTPAYQPSACVETPPTTHPAKLSTVQAVLFKYSKLLGEQTMGEFAAKMAREAFFGEHLIARSTVFGKQGMKALPQDKMAQLKEVIFLFPQYACTPHFLEPIWTRCINAINHACSKERQKLRK